MSSDEIEVCPDCETPEFYTNVETDFEGPEAQAAYWCRNCEVGFDEPDTREREAVGGRRGLAGILDDDDAELATDGGVVQTTADPDPGPCIQDDKNADLPAHIDPCSCDNHDGVCKECQSHITIGSEATEYGHARAYTRSSVDQDCKHRPESVNPSNYRVMTDGGPNAVDEPAENVEHHPDGFHSSEPHLLDGGMPDPDPADPSEWCYECGDERIGACGVCGMPLCGRHLETGAGFCTDRVTVDTRVGAVAACIRTLAGEREVAVDAREFNYARPQRARLAPDEIERAVRERLPDALIEQAAEAVADGIDRLDGANDRRTAQRLLAVDDALLFALTADQADRRDGWLEQAADALAACLDGLEHNRATVAMDLTPAVGYLEQLGVDVDAGDDGGDPGEQ